MNECDLLISLGGDHTYLKSSSFIPDWSIPILGINTTTESEKGALTYNHINAKNANI